MTTTQPKVPTSTDQPQEWQPETSIMGTKKKPWRKSSWTPNRLHHATRTVALQSDTAHTWMENSRRYLRDHGCEPVFTKQNVTIADQERLQFGHQVTKVQHGGRVITTQYKLSHHTTMPSVASSSRSLVFTTKMDVPDLFVRGISLWAVLLVW